MFRHLKCHPQGAHCAVYASAAYVVTVPATAKTYTATTQTFYYAVQSTFY